MSKVEEFQDHILPVIVFFVILNVVGFLGNILVIFIYSFRYEKNDFRRLVLSLSFVDMISCCTTVPMETASSWFWFRSPSRGLCKMKNFCVQFSATSAIYMLFVTAIYKYLRICRPFGRQVTQKNILILFTIGICVSLVLATPAAVIWDVNGDITTFQQANETTRICEVSKEMGKTAFPIVYRSILSIYDLFVIATIIMYAFVAKKIILHIRRRKQRMKGGQYEVESTASANDVEKSKATQCTQDSEQETKGAPSQKPVAKQRRTKRQTSRLSSSQIRKAVIMVVLAGIFSVTFLMGLSFGYVFVVRQYKDFASLGEIVRLFACYRIYFANYALNPIVYLILDSSFRGEVLKVLWLNKFSCVNTN